MELFEQKFKEFITEDFKYPTLDYLDDKEKYFVEGIISDILDILKKDRSQFNNMISRLIRNIRDSRKELYGGKNPFYDVVYPNMSMVRDEPMTLEFIKDFLTEYPDFIGTETSTDFFTGDDFETRLRKILANWISIKKPNAAKLYRELRNDIDKIIIMRSLEDRVNK